MKFEISNETERFLIVQVGFMPFVGITIFLYLTSSTIDIYLILYAFILLLLLVVSRISKKLSPWDKPNVYVVTEDEVWRALHYEEGDSFAKYKLSSIKKLVLKNRRTKWIKLWFKDNKDRPLEIFSAPFFEKCNAEWQQLFEEIRKRIPPEAEVIVK